MKKNFILFLIFILLLPIIFFFKSKLSSKRPVKVIDNLAYFPSGKLIRLTGPNVSSLIADLAWIQIIQYYGEENKKDGDFSNLKKTLFTLVEIDPNFIAPYTLGAFLLIGDPLNDYISAIKLLDIGIRENPDKWQFLFTKGFIFYLEGTRADSSLKKKYYRYAGILFKLASKKNEAPYYTKTFAAATAGRIGDPLLASEIWFTLYENTEKDNLKELYLRNFKLEITRYCQKIISNNPDKIITIDSLHLPQNYKYLPDSEYLIIKNDSAIWISD